MITKAILISWIKEWAALSALLAASVILTWLEFKIWKKQKGDRDKKIMCLIGIILVLSICGYAAFSLYGRTIATLTDTVIYSEDLILLNSASI